MRLWILAAGLSIAVPALAGDAAGEAVADYTIGADRLAAGSSVDVTAPVAGDAWLTGGEVTIGAPVAGAAFAAGGHVDIQGPVDKGLYVAAGSVTLSSTVRRDARLLGDTIDVTPAATIGGSAVLAGRTVTMAGEVGGSLQIAARDAVISGRVAGDVEVSAERVEVGPQARVGGRLRYRAGHEPQVAAGALITGGLETLSGRDGHFGWHDRARRATSAAARALWFTGSLVLGALLLLIGPAFMSETSAIARREWAQSLGIGCIVLVTVPLAVVLLFITLIGIPLGLLAIALYAAALLLGYVCGATALADLALERLAPSRTAQVGWRILALLGALAALALLRPVPLFGKLAVFAVLLGGLGALTQRALRTARPASSA
jgi:hypothetical protein